MTPFLEAAKKDPKISKYISLETANEPLTHSKTANSQKYRALSEATEPFAKILKDMNQ